MRTWICVVAGCCLALLIGRPDIGRAAEKYEAKWESLDQRATPQWWIDAKSGVFIHWGVYSVPAWSVPGQYSEWYWNRIRGDKGKNGPWWQYHKATYGEDFDYAAFAPMFKAELFDPDHWADDFERGGAKYVEVSAETSVTMLGLAQSINWWSSNRNVVIEVPALSVDEVACKYAYTFKITHAK